MFNSFSYNIINAQKSDNIQLHSQTLDVISNQTKALENSSSIKVDNYPVAMILGSNNKIYVYNYDSYTISVIDGNNNTVVKNITVGNGPHYIIYNPVTNTIYISNALSNSIFIIDGAVNKVVTGATFQISQFNSGHI